MRRFSLPTRPWRAGLPWLGGLACVGVLAGCVSSLLSRSAGFDARPVSLQTVSLFNQRTPSRAVRVGWKGDWVLRRDRLEMVDRELRNLKPDIVVLQEVMARIGSQSESDQHILSAGALADYDWLLSPKSEYADSQESESLAMAVSVPLRFFALPGKGDDDETHAWRLGKDGWMMAATIDYEEQPLQLFNVQLPSKSSERSVVLYSFIRDRIKERLARFHHCGKRLVLAGYLPDEPETAAAAPLFGDLNLKDVATGFCQVSSRCYTATPTNDVFLATVGDESPARVDRIFVHQSAFVYTSGRSFDDFDMTNRYVKGYALQRLWPTQRFGWASSVRLSRCASEELD